MKILISLLFAVLLGSCTSKNENSVNDINYSQGIKNGSVVGLDVRNADEVKTNAAPSSVNIPSYELKQKMYQLDDNKTILVFCESGSRASKAKELLEQNGFKNVVNIKDWRAWNKIQEKK